MRPLTAAHPSSVLICQRCVMDSSDPDLQLDALGVCNHCHQFDSRQLLELPDPIRRESILTEVVQKMKDQGRGKAYDCVIGLSGGVDSSYVALQVHRLGLRALGVHLDNGWNSEAAVSNINQIVTRLGIDLHTNVLNWEEFRDLQKAFFRASVVNCEMPTDHAILATLFQAAARHKVNYILSGSNFVSEGIFVPMAWGYDYRDWRNLKAIHRAHGSTPLHTYPRLPLRTLGWHVAINRVRFFPLLNYVHYHKEEAIAELMQKIGWRQYGRKHGESIFTRFYQEYYLVQKFGYDKRRLHLSALINSRQVTRDEALRQLQAPLFSEDELRELVVFVCKKLGFSETEWSEVMRTPPRSHFSYRTNPLLTRNSVIYNVGRRLATGRPKNKKNEA